MSYKILFLILVLCLKLISCTAHTPDIVNSKLDSLVKWIENNPDSIKESRSYIINGDTLFVYVEW